MKLDDQGEYMMQRINCLKKLFIIFLVLLGFSPAPLLSNTQDNQEKTVLLTGAAGFIGSNFLKYMFDKYPSYNFLVLDVLTYAGNLDNIPDYIKTSSRFGFFYGSITNPRLVDLLMSKSDFVVHFAAESHVTRSIYDSALFFETDVIGTRVLMDSLVKHHKKVQRFIHISTSEVYGTAETVPMDEEHPINPRSPYAAAKAGADRLVYAYQCTYDISTVIIRLFNNYGPSQHLEKLIPRFITSAMKREPLTIHGDGTQTRDWLHVTDTCYALDKILHHPDFATIKNQVINIGSGEDTSVRDIAKIILDYFDLPESFITFCADRPGQVCCHISSTKKAKQLLDWQASISLEEGIQQTIAWYQANESWWRKREIMQHVPVSLEGKKVEMQ